MSSKLLWVLYAGPVTVGLIFKSVGWGSLIYMPAHNIK